MNIRRLNLQFPGQPGSAHRFAREFSLALARQGIPTQNTQRIHQLQVPIITARPGESERSLAQRAALQVAQAVRESGGAS